MRKLAWLAIVAAFGLILGGCDSKKPVLPEKKLEATKNGEKIDKDQGSKTLPPEPKQ